jgi:signal transduction histidine kinase/ActR/RegA family two-component response regulator
MLHAQVSAYVWKWEKEGEFDEHEIPREIFDKKKEHFSPHEPFTILMDGRACSVRMRATDSHFPPDCQWFVKENYVDYLALPITHRTEFKGGMAWSTKNPGGFSNKHIQFFERSLAALSTVMRLHTNDLVMKTLTGRLEEEVAERTLELEVANHRLEEAHRQVTHQSEAQLEHFACMSHEIRTPLNCIVGMSSLLLGSGLSAVHEESAQMISQSGELLAAIVDDVLDYSKLESGIFDVDIQQTNLQLILATVVYSIGIRGRERNVEVRSLFDENLPNMVETDSRRLQQVLYNLLGNAIKFSKEGGTVDLKVSMCHKSDNASFGTVLRLAVKDNGKGIAKDDMQKIFEPFNQGSKETERLYGGTGLGLAITSKLVKALGGTVSVDSAVGEWTEFVVDLPCQEPAVGMEVASSSAALSVLVGPQENEPADSSVGTAVTEAFTGIAPTVRPSTPSLLPDKLLVKGGLYEKIKVLIAEDNLINQKVLHRMLTRLGLKHVDIVDNGRKAVDLCAVKEFDIVFMDLEMPVMDGLEATRLIVQGRQAENGIGPWIAFLTATASSEAKCREAGGDSFITKPIKIGQVESLLLALTLSMDATVSTVKAPVSIEPQCGSLGIEFRAKIPLLRHPVLPCPFRRRKTSPYGELKDMCLQVESPSTKKKKVSYGDLMDLSL